MATQAPFLEVSSFVMDDREGPITIPASGAPSTPFLSLYEFEDSNRLVDPQAEEYAQFLNELYDEEFEDALFELVSEATAFHENRVRYEHGEPRTSGYEAERLLDQHFAPLLSETQAMLESLATEFGRRDPKSISDEEVETLVEGYQPSSDLAPAFENFFGKVKKAVKKVARKAVSLAKKGLSAAAKLGVGPMLSKLKGLIKPLLKRVISMAIGKLPSGLQPIARKLAQRLPYLKEVEEGHETLADHAVTSEFAQIQLEFDRHVAKLLFAHDEAQQDLEFVESITEEQIPATFPLVELDRARDEFVENLARLEEGEDPTPYVQQFIPAILPTLKVGINLVGRKRVVDFLAGLLAKLIQKFVGPRFAPALSQAIVDAGLRLIHLETTPQDEVNAAASAVAATVEETVRRVSALPDYVLDNQELLEGFALEAFEQAAAANLPQVLPEEAYRRRPDLAEARKLRGAWVLMPHGRRRRYKKFTRRVPVKLVPHQLLRVESFGGVPLGEFLEEQFGVAPGEEVDGFVHLYETLPGTQLTDIARMEEHTPGLGTPGGFEQFHPLTPEAAGALLGEPELGRDTGPQQLADMHTPVVGQRLYYLEVSGKRLLTTPTVAGGRAKARRSTQVRLTLDFPKNEIRVYLFLSEIRAQEVAVKLRRGAHIGAVTTQLRAFLERGLRGALSGAFGRMKIIHEAVTPEQWAGALNRLPSLVPRILLGRLQEWSLKGLAENLKQHAQLFIKAAEDATDGVTVAITIGAPPEFDRLRQALKGKGVALASLKMVGASPTVGVKFAAGYARD